MSRLLIIEDEPRLALALQRGLQDELHAADVERDGSEGLAAAMDTDYDLIILDLMLPGMSGLEICRRLRHAGREMPILMLTAKDNTQDIVIGLDAGADDYLTKPFAFEELLARLRSLLRRTPGYQGNRLRAGALEIDPAAHRTWMAGEEISLTAREYQLLEALVRRQGMVLSRGRLTDLVWERDMGPDSNAIEVHIASLRRKLALRGHPPVIATIRGVGYVIRPEGL